jgi:hypothetical protein
MTYPKGEHLTEEHRKKISLAHKGKPKPWLHGRKHTPEARTRMSRAVKKGYQEGRPPWNKGIKYPPERLEQMSKIMKSYYETHSNYWKGKDVPREIVEKRRLGQLEYWSTHPAPNKGKKHTEKTCKNHVNKVR